jgi:hypothetical protein
VIPHPPADPAARERRKRDLLLASELARGQAAAALEQVGSRVDRVAYGAIRLRAWAVQPPVWIAGGALALFVLLRLRSLRALRWGLLGLRAWRVGRSILEARRST